MANTRVKHPAGATAAGWGCYPQPVCAHRHGYRGRPGKQPNRPTPRRWRWARYRAHPRQANEAGGLEPPHPTRRPQRGAGNPLPARRPQRGAGNPPPHPVRRPQRGVGNPRPANDNSRPRPKKGTSDGRDPQKTALSTHGKKGQKSTYAKKRRNSGGWNTRKGRPGTPGRTGAPNGARPQTKTQGTITAAGAPGGRQGRAG